MRASSNEDGEISFHPRYEGETTNNETVTDNSKMGELTLRSQASDNALVQGVTDWVQGLERDVGSLKSKVNSIDTKLDLLLSSAGFGAPTAASTPPRPSRPARGGGERRTPGADNTLPPPRQLRRTENEDGYVDDMLRKERFVPLHSEGKNHLATDIFSDSVMPKPYMYVNRDGVTTLKQKLEIRSSLTYAEYINASINLVMDHRACGERDREYILQHIYRMSPMTRSSARGRAFAAGHNLSGMKSIRGTYIGHKAKKFKIIDSGWHHWGLKQPTRNTKGVAVASVFAAHSTQGGDAATGHIMTKGACASCICAHSATP